MIVNVEFFDENLIENVITSLNYKVDKTIFLGYSNMTKEHRQCAERFLKEFCQVQSVEFHVVDEFDLSDILDILTNIAETHIQAGHKLFFDLTGGEDLLLVAFGLLSRELQVPMHVYDVYSGRIHEYGYDSSPLLSASAEYAPITLDIDGFISLYGGKINYRMHKDFKDTWSEEDIKDIEAMWELSREYDRKWVFLSALFRKFVPDENLAVYTETKDVLAELKRIGAIGGIRVFNRFLDRCEALGLLEHVCHENGICRYRYKNQLIKNCFWDGGSILEMHTFLKELQKGDQNDCMAGVHVDWDGVIHKHSDEDVLNEIDVVSIKNNLPTFFSCKIGNTDQMDLYELETIANRFGGKYAKKILVVVKEMSPSHLLRAKELGIEVRRYLF